MTSMISVIVPIYNAEDYLEECLGSLCGQSYDNLQIILINDGSTDSSLEIATRYASEDSRILLINQPNAGVAAARQKGLERAKGDYIIHCDSDDLVPRHAYECLIGSINESNAAVAVGNYTVRYPTNDVSFSYTPAEAPELLQKILTGDCRGSLWNKLIRKDLYRDLFFESGKDFMEDKLILVKMLSREHVEMAYVDAVVYIYRIVQSSYTNTMSEKSVSLSIEVENRITELVADRFDESFLAYVKNKRRIASLLNSRLPQKSIFSEADSFLMSEKRIPFHHRFLLWCDIKGAYKVVDIYKFMQSLLGRR